MLGFYGTHGTSLSKAERIKKEGFDTKPGRIGVGAYFWTAISDEDVDLATRFAKGWYSRQSNKFRYDVKSQCAVIKVEVGVKEDEILYLDDPEHHLALRSILSKTVEKELGVASVFDEEVDYERVKPLFSRLNAVVEIFIKRVERRLEHPVKVVFKAQVAPVDDHLKSIVGMSTCFAVRDTSCIRDLTILGEGV